MSFSAIEVAHLNTRRRTKSSYRTMHRRFVEAIDVCDKVLAQYPDYPKIREEILNKAYASLRP